MLIQLLSPEIVLKAITLGLLMWGVKTRFGNYQIGYFWTFLAPVYHRRIGVIFGGGSLMALVDSKCQYLLPAAVCYL